MKLAFREYGQGQPLLILHGLFGQSDNWNTMAKNFAEKGFRVFTIDQRNHGLSPHSREWNYAIMADDLMQFITDHSLTKPIILGHSMGGKIVMNFESMYPGVSDKLIIADISPRAYAPHHDTVLKALHAVNFDLVKTRKEVESIMGNYISDFGTRQFLLKNIYWKDVENSRMDWRFNLEVISANYNNIGSEAPLFKSEVPTLVIRGSLSDYISNLDLPDFEKRFLNMRLFTITGAGHWVHAEKPLEFFEAVLSFITN